MAAEKQEAFSSLQDRISALERSSWNVGGVTPSSAGNNDADANASTIIITPAMTRARRHTQTSHCFSAIWRHCPSDYYSRSLDERVKILGANNVSQLCKACLFENKNYVCGAGAGAGEGEGKGGDDDKDKVDPTNSRYYLIVVQYIESITAKKLASELRGLRPPGSTRFSPTYFSDLRLAPADESVKLTGYGHNGVSPFGMLDSTIPIVLCASITKIRPQFIWMGGGHPDWKLGVSVSEFIEGLNAIVLDVSEPRANTLETEEISSA
ncbi:hypothetical protein ACHAWU_005031 [Discostella pseudostelligera]|uniref:YbaK/aminoacyl-tRNA synthetase-associated domain-containing protein n=1 Tax=Discostella pseudostelligera TaxID=259834 RepID=A0ABD3M8Q8_9STRA